MQSIAFNVRVRRLIRYLLGCSFIWICCGCAQFQQQILVDVETQLRENQTDAALETLKSLKSTGRGRALYSLNKAMILRQQGRFEESVESFETAKKQIGQLDAVSVTESLSEYLLTEQFSSYQATVYEKLFIHLFQIMNFLALDELESARVEALQIDLALLKLTEAGHYEAAATARYMSGLIFEALKEGDDALIAYRLAHSNYEQANLPTPRDLQKRMIVLANDLGLNNEYEQWRELFDVQATESKLDQTGELIVFYNIDFAPTKSQRQQAIFDPDSGHIYQIALPHFDSREIPNVRFQTSVQGRNFGSETLADIESIAIDDLDKKLPKLTLKALSRNVARRQAAKKAEKKDEVLGELVQVLGLFLEQADLRNWRTLPNRIHIGSQLFDKGTYDVSITVLDEQNEEIDLIILEDVEIKENEKTFLAFHWFQHSDNSIH